MSIQFSLTFYIIYCYFVLNMYTFAIYKIDGLVQDSCISIANALELPQYGTKSSK